MKCPQLLFLCWFSSIPAMTSCIRVDTLSCVSAYWDTVSCVLNITGNPVEPFNTTYSLKFSTSAGIFRITYSCALVWMNPSYHCDCKVTNGSTLLMSLNKYNVDICNNSGCWSLMRNFNPSKNIQLTPPNEVQVQETPEGFNVTWKSGYENHEYLDKFVEYQLLLQSFQRNVNQTRHLSPLTNSLLIHPKMNAECCIKVRSLPKVYNIYSGTWSKWSSSTCWISKLPKEPNSPQENENVSVILTKYLAPVCVVVGVLLFVFSRPATRMKIKTLSHTPSPAPFFQPLFQQYEGSLQEWLSPQGTFALMYKTEEILTTSDVTVVPKPMTKDPEENQVFHNPSVTQLAFTQCQTSYVGLPGTHEVSPPVTIVCPGDTSYTQLPSSIWGLNAGEVQVISSPPKDVSEMSCCDSGCSFESPTESPECSLPTSPVEKTSPPFYCNDYCILNKTAEGVVPVLVYKGSSPNVPSDPHQKDGS
ncbi:uncharacterized protein [Channa argus]|uniref:uncharacterized protein n=1 Tax=Channa argus TaxID=215402 RepID=UPI003520DBA1